MFTRIHWQSPQLFWLMAMILSGVFMAVIWFYRPQVRTLGSRWSWALMALRVIALAALGLSILKPSVLLPATRRGRDVVAVLIDQSRSMTIVDQARSPVQLVQIADALGLLPAGARRSDLEASRQKVADLQPLASEVTLARGEEEYARLSGRGIESATQHRRDTEAALAAAVSAAASSAPPELAALIQRITPATAADDIPVTLERIGVFQASADEVLYRANAAARGACDQLAGLSRIGLVQRALDGEKGLLARLGRDHDVELFGFSQSLEPLPGLGSAVDADGDRSNLAAALRELRSKAAGSPMGAVVVFSDGRQVVGAAGTPAGAAAAAPWNDVPIVGVPTSADVVKDLSINRVTLPSSAFVGELITIRVDVSSVGFDGQTVEVAVEGAGQRQTRPVYLIGDGGRAEMSLSVDRPGPLELNIRVTPRPGEITAANNTVSRVVKAIGEKIHVALIGGVATRDFQQLRIALAKAPGFTVRDRLVDASHPCDLSPETLADMDLVILSDVPTAALSQRQWDSVVKLVNDRGGSAMIICGDPALAGSYLSSALAASLLPWRGGAEGSPTWRVWPGDTPLLRIVPSGSDVLEALRLSSDADISRLRWNQLPPVFRFISMPPLKTGVRPLLIDRESAQPVMTEMRQGAGRVLFLGLSEVWRWREAMSGRDEDRIWLQMLRYASREPFAASNGALSLDVDRLRIEPGENLHVRGRIDPAMLVDNEEVTPVLRVFRGGTPVREQPFALAPRSNDEYDALLADLPAGNYEVQFAAADQSVSLSAQVVQSDEAEMRDVSGDPAAMAQLAGTHGQVVQFSDLHGLPQRLANVRRDEPRFVELTLWDSPYLFLFVLGCLGFEWAVRKRMGLA
jgi:hypothetical protein